MMVQIWSFIVVHKLQRRRELARRAPAGKLLAHVETSECTWRLKFADGLFES